MTEPELTSVLHRLIRLKFETQEPLTIMNRMGPSWVAEAFVRLRKAIDAGETITIETLWGPPGAPNLWRLKA